MDQGTPSSPRPAKPGLDPRNALDILDIRTARQMQTGASHADLASRADAGADMLHYLATHAGAATRAAVAANPAAAAVTNRLLADDEAEDVRAELAVKIARLMPGLSERESSHVFALTIETLECLARDAAPSWRKRSRRWTAYRATSYWLWRATFMPWSLVPSCNIRRFCPTLT
jgi:hypothetical protein